MSIWAPYRLDSSCDDRRLDYEQSKATTARKATAAGMSKEPFQLAAEILNGALQPPRSERDFGRDRPQAGIIAPGAGNLDFDLLAKFAGSDQVGESTEAPHLGSAKAHDDVAWLNARRISRAAAMHGSNLANSIAVDSDDTQKRPPPIVNSDARHSLELLITLFGDLCAIELYERQQRQIYQGGEDLVLHRRVIEANLFDSRVGGERLQSCFTDLRLIQVQLFQPAHFHRMLNPAVASVLAAENQDRHINHPLRTTPIQIVARECFTHFDRQHRLVERQATGDLATGHFGAEPLQFIQSGRASLLRQLDQCRGCPPSQRGGLFSIGQFGQQLAGLIRRVDICRQTNLP